MITYTIKITYVTDEARASHIEEVTAPNILAALDKVYDTFTGFSGTGRNNEDNVVEVLVMHTARYTAKQKDKVKRG